VRPRSIAVLPFKPLVANERDEALELGMADALITRLSSLKQIIVRPTSAVRNYTALDQDPLAAGRQQQVEQYRNTIELDPGFAPAHRDLGLALEWAGRNDEAIAAPTITVSAAAAIRAAPRARASPMQTMTDHDTF